MERQREDHVGAGPEGGAVNGHKSDNPGRVFERKELSFTLHQRNTETAARQGLLFLALL